MGDDPSGDDSGSEPLAERVERLYAELEATEERPVDRTASRWIGEAQAVAGDAADLASDGDDESTASTVRERVGHVADLLDNVDGTGDPDADERVETAKSLAAEIAGDDGEN
ncbi:hypothetical protein [Halosimplex halobium]|uniref:hypothetical protein n=1 Tax=Halosimplex halobium TaxID=3396618 RepID=UPI003F558D82